jgi:glucoamylase
VLDDYVAYSRSTQLAGLGVGFACYRVDGTPRDGRDPQNPQEAPWSVQSDGPALRVLALLSAWSQLSPASQATARQVIADDCAWLLDAYPNPTTNLWEETVGLSFFARSVQRRCFQALAAQSGALSLGLSVTQLTAASADLETRLQGHWRGDHYASILNAGGDHKGEDLNADAVMAAVYGAVDVADPQLLATAAALRAFFAAEFTINHGDPAPAPLIGRYPLDTYDGDDSAPGGHSGHPWAPCTCVFAELYYRVALAVKAGKSVPIAAPGEAFFEQVGIDRTTQWPQAVTLLALAGDAMLDAVVRHSDHLELSEQFDRDNGFEKSVRNLTWSYASYLSAVRARQAI